jgi:hypothetical protein
MAITINHQTNDISATSGSLTIDGASAGSAATLTTARAIQVSGAVTGTANFDGSADINIVTTNTADPVLTLAGDATGSATFTNLGNATLTVAVVDDSHNHSSSSGNFTVGGNLVVNGTTVTVNATTITIDDPIITLGGDTTPGADDNKDRGIEFKWHNGSVAKVGFFGFDDSTGYLTFIPDATNTSEVFSGSVGDIQATNFRGALVGNASTATTLETARTINSVSFDGSANITVADSTKVAKAGDTMTGNLSFGDNNKAIFGAELEIYSDATHARIREYGGGQLKIQGDNMQLLTSAGTATYLEGNASTGAVTLYHASNAPRVATTATGIDVTGTVVADGLTVDGDGLLYSASNVEMRGDANVRISLGTAGTSGANNNSNWIYGNGTNLRFNNAGGFYSWETLGTERLRIDSSGNVFVNGTTQIAGSKLNVRGTSAYIGVGGTVEMLFGDSGSSEGFLGTFTNHPLTLRTNNTERLRIASSGNVGIGVVPPTDAHATWSQLFLGEKGSFISEKSNSGGIYGNYVTDNLYIDADTGSFANITTDESSAYSQEAGVHKFYSQASGSAGAAVTLSEKMTINSSGNVGIGTSSPGRRLHVLFSNSTAYNSSSFETDSLGSYIRNTDTTVGSYVGMQFAVGNNSDAAIAAVRTADANAALTFGTRGTGSGAIIERMRISSTGNVGIGVTNPAAMLEFGPNTTDNKYDIKAPSDSARGIGLGGYTTFSTRYSSWDTLIGTNIRSKIGTSLSGEETASSYTASGGAGLRIGFQDLQFKTYSPAELSGLATGSDVNSLGTTRFKVDTSGNVGIGMTPTNFGNGYTVLQVANASNGGMLYLTNTANAGGRIYGNGAGLTYDAFSTTYHAFITNSAERLRIDSSGNVGIGTSSPDTTTKLTVAGAITVTGANSGHGASRLKLGQDTSAISQIRFYGADNSTAGILQFTGSSADGVVGAERMRIDSSGNVGIGSSTANHFSITGTANVLGVKSSSGALVSIAATGTNFSGIDLGTDSLRRAGVYSLNGSVLGFYTNPTNSGSGLTERLRIDSSGNVGIGTTSPSTYGGKLSVVSAASTQSSILIQNPGIGSGHIGLDATTSNIKIYNCWATGLLGDGVGIDIAKTTGNVGIGTTTPSQKLVTYVAAANVIEILSTVRNDNAGTGVAAIGFNVSWSGSEADSTQAGIGYRRGVANGGGDLIFYNRCDGAAGNFTSSHERMFLYGSSGSYALGLPGNLSFVGTASSTRIHLPGGTAGPSNSGIAAAWNVHSDYRLKENVATITTATEAVSRLRPVTFSWIEENEPEATTAGFIAHEMAEVAPYSVMGEKDAVNEDGSIRSQGADYSKLVPLLTAALQEALTEITALKARVTALEA